LVEAKKRVSDGFGDLNELEQNYIEASIQQELEQERVEENARVDRERAVQERDRFEKEQRAREDEAASRLAQERERFEREEEALRREKIVWRRQVLYGGIIGIVVAILGGVAYVQNRAKEAQMIAMQERFTDTIVALQKQLADNKGSSSRLWTDSATGLIWAGSDNGENVTWTTADNFCRDLRIGNYSSGWRLPKINELKSIFDPKHDYRYTYHGQPYGGMVDGQAAVNLIKAGVELNSCCAWSSQTTTDANKLQSAYYYRFQPNPRDGIRDPSIHIETVALIRALCVHDP
jgi:hypothetical protein